MTSRHRLNSIFGLLIYITMCCSPTFAKEKKEDEKLLEKFFELGLPDVKGAKWVKVFVSGSQDYDAITNSFKFQLSGNAWLLSERNGVVELLAGSGRLIRGRKWREGMTEPYDERAMLSVSVSPANLKEDIKLLPAAVKDLDEADTTPESRVNSAGVLLLFLAELQRHGHAEIVKEILPQALALAPSKETALDAAVSLVADGQLAAIVRDWIQNGDVAATTKALDALVARFHHGWQNQAAARLFTTRMRKQEAATRAGERDAKEAAKFLMNINMKQFERLPFNSNWLITDVKQHEHYERGRGAFCGSPAFVRVGGKAVFDDPTTAFLAKKRELVSALEKLIDDRRFLRVESWRDDHWGSGRFSHNESERGVGYDGLQRPWELGELAWRMIRPILTDNVESEIEGNPQERMKLVSAFLKTILAKNDEELAWFYLHAAADAGNLSYQSLDYLINKGSQETLSKLRELFLDSKVWSEYNSFDEMLVRVEEYLKRAPQDAAFAKNLRAAVKAGTDAYRERYQDATKPETEDDKRQQAHTRAAQMKLIDLAINHPGDLPRKFTEIAAMNEDEESTALFAIVTGLGRWSSVEVEAAILKTVATMGTPTCKQCMMQFMRNVYEPQTDGMFNFDSALPIPSDAATRAAILTLLQDETPILDTWAGNRKTTIGDFTAEVLFSISIGGKKRTTWGMRSHTVSYLNKKWLRANAMAIASGKPSIPLPYTEKFSSRQTTMLIRGLSALAAIQVPAALAEKSPDEQTAIITRLDAVKTWPVSLSTAHFTIGKVSGDGAADLDAENWKGRRLDEKLINEIIAAIQKAAVAGKYLTVTASIAGALAGCEIVVVKTPKMMTQQQLVETKLPGLVGKASPLAVCSICVGTGMFSDDVDFSARFGFPIWKDDTQTLAWQNEHGQPRPEPEDPERFTEPWRKKVSANPLPFQTKLKEYFSMKSGYEQRGAFKLTICSTAVRLDK